MITGKIIKGANLDQQFRGAIPNMESGVQKTVMELALKLTANVKGEKLSGQVLHVRTGNLRRSIHPEWDMRPNYAGAIVGTDEKYAAIHEYGGEIVPKDKPYLVFKIGDQWIRTKKVTMPERSFLRSAIKEMAPEIRETLEKSVLRELKKIGK